MKFTLKLGRFALAAARTESGNTDPIAAAIEPIMEELEARRLRSSAALSMPAFMGPVLPSNLASPLPAEEATATPIASFVGPRALKPAITASFMGPRARQPTDNASH